jgi:hypothetical protein
VLDRSLIGVNTLASVLSRAPAPAFFWTGPGQYDPARPAGQPPPASDHQALFAVPDLKYFK